MTIEEQIKELNEEVRCHIRPSPIQGIGVFALRDIKQDERLYLIPNPIRQWYSVPFERLNELRSEIKEIVLARWPSIINGSLFQSPNDDCWLCSFVNHSENDNYDINSDSAKKDILAGEEITENYKTMFNYKIVYPWLV